MDEHLIDNFIINQLQDRNFTKFDKIQILLPYLVLKNIKENDSFFIQIPCDKTHFPLIISLFADIGVKINFDNRYKQFIYLNSLSACYLSATIGQFSSDIENRIDGLPDRIKSRLPSNFYTNFQKVDSYWIENPVKFVRRIMRFGAMNKESGIISISGSNLEFLNVIKQTFKKICIPVFSLSRGIILNRVSVEKYHQKYGLPFYLNFDKFIALRNTHILLTAKNQAEAKSRRLNSNLPDNVTYILKYYLASKISEELLQYTLQIVSSDRELWSRKKGFVQDYMALISALAHIQLFQMANGNYSVNMHHSIYNEIHQKYKRYFRCSVLLMVKYKVRSICKTYFYKFREEFHANVISQSVFDWLFEFYSQSLRIIPDIKSYNKNLQEGLLLKTFLADVHKFFYTISYKDIFYQICSLDNKSNLINNEFMESLLDILLKSNIRIKFKINYDKIFLYYLLKVFNLGERSIDVFPYTLTLSSLRDMKSNIVKAIDVSVSSAIDSFSSEILRIRSTINNNSEFTGTLLSV